MKKTLVILLAVAVVLGAGAYMFLSINEEKSLDSLSGQTATYSSSELGLQFAYRPGPTGYVVEEMTPSNTSGELVRTLVLMRTEDVGKAPDGSEGPATITIHVLKNTGKQQSLAWAESHIQYSNINLKMGEVAESVVGGANAVRYMADGLYASDNAVVAHGEYVYVLSGMFVDQDSDLRRDFEPLVRSVRFIPTPGQE